MRKRIEREKEEGEERKERKGGRRKREGRCVAAAPSVSADIGSVSA